MVGSAHHTFAEEPKWVLLPYHSYPTNLIYAKTIRAELEREMSDSIELYDARYCQRPTKIVEDRYAYLRVHFRDQRRGLIVAIDVGGRGEMMTRCCLSAASPMSFIEQADTSAASVPIAPLQFHIRRPRLPRQRRVWSPPNSGRGRMTAGHSGFGWPMSLAR